MAFVGILGTLIALGVAAFVVLIISIAPIIIGTIILHKTEHKKLGVILRIYGYIAFIPTWALAIFGGIRLLEFFAQR